MTELPKTSAPASRALASIGISNLEDLTQFTEKEIADLHGMGPKAMVLLKKAMNEIGLEFQQG